MLLVRLPVIVYSYILGEVKSYLWTSDCMRAGAPNLHIVQGQTVYYILCFDLSSHLDS